MFNQPKGLIPAALANMGERFGFYTMMAILTLFLTSKFGISGEEAGRLYSIFYGSIYILALVGGLIADWTKNYKGTIIAGIIVMMGGYLLLSVPALITEQWIAMGALLVIAFGNGLFKGNLQAIVGQLYDNDKWASKRDSGFQLFYMFINVGGMIAPFAATWVRNWFVKSQGYAYNSDLPGLCWQLKHATAAEPMSDKATQSLTELAAQVSNGVAPTNLSEFADNYLNAFNTGFHYAFSVAIVAMLISLLIFLAYKRILPTKSVVKAANKPQMSAEEIHQNAKEIKQRLLALFAVFAVVIFFWFSFHQNGLTLTYFARDYTQLKIFGMEISAELFQSTNPFVVVFLTPIIMAIFAAMARRGKEPSTPRKIGIGMGIAALAFAVLAIGSMGLPFYSELKDMGGLPFDQRVTPWLLLAVYFILTVAELFISPLGLSFVSKVAPSHLQGLMQGCWLGATAVGNFSLFLGAMMYERISLSVTWSVFVIVCAISMIAMFSMVTWLERVSSSKQSA